MKCHVLICHVHIPHYHIPDICLQREALKVLLYCLAASYILELLVL